MNYFSAIISIMIGAASLFAAPQEVQQPIEVQQTAAADLAGKSIAFAGDSITVGSYTTGSYAELIGSEENMIVTNKGAGGAAVAKNVTWSKDDTNFRPSVIDSVRALKDNYDYIVVEGGINDFWNHVSVGELTDGFDGTFDEKTFAGALETIFSELRANHPESKTGYLIVHDVFTYDAEEGFAPYYEMIKSACEKWNVPYLDLYSVNNKETGVNVKDAEQRKYYFGSDYTPDGDGIHPNPLGYKEIYVDPMVEWLKSMND